MTWLKKNSTGFTLIEILVTLAISGIILTGVLFVFDTSNKSYIVQEDIVRMQQSVRMAKFYLEKDLRMTGYGVRGIAFDGELIYPISFVNNDSPGDANVLDNTDSINLMYMDDEADGCGTGGASRSCAELPQLTLQGTKPPTSTVANVNEVMKDNDPYLYWDEDCSCGSYNYTSPSFGYQAIITSPDGSMSDIVFITGASAKQAGSTSTLSNGPNHTYIVDGITYDNKQLNTYPAGSTINFFDSASMKNIRYYIDTDLFLMRDDGTGPVKVAENIEDIQFAFCGDFDGDGVVDTAAVGDWFDETNLVAGEMTDTDKSKIRFVRVSILGRTAKEHQGISSSRPGIEDHAASANKDFYSRRVLSFTVKVRNLGLDD